MEEWQRRRQATQMLRACVLVHLYMCPHTAVCDGRVAVSPPGPASLLYEDTYSSKRN
jgi:hypothetical protein